MSGPPPAEKRVLSLILTLLGFALGLTFAEMSRVWAPLCNYQVFVCVLDHLRPLEGRVCIDSTDLPE